MYLRDLAPVPLLKALLRFSVGAVLLFGVVVREVRIGRRPLCRGCSGGCGGRSSGGRGRLLLRKVHGYLNVSGFGLRVKIGFGQRRERQWKRDGMLTSFNFILFDIMCIKCTRGELTR